FDDGWDSGAAVTHTFTGTHGVWLIVMDDRAALGATFQNVNQPPVVSFTTTCAGLTCMFDGSGSYDPDGVIVGGLWDFGDSQGGSPLTTTHTYLAAGTYIVTLSLIDQDGAKTSYSQSVTVNAPPLVSFTSTCSAVTCQWDDRPLRE